MPPHPPCTDTPHRDRPHGPGCPADAIERLMLGKEKLAGLRWCSHVVTPSGDLVGRHPVVGAFSWAEHVSGVMCSLHGTADGMLDTVDGRSPLHRCPAL